MYLGGGIVDKIKYVQSFSFIYSPRPGTMAYNLKNNIEENEKKRRLYILQNKLKFYQEKFNKNFIKKPLEVLFNDSSNKKNQSNFNKPRWNHVPKSI